MPDNHLPLSSIGGLSVIRWNKTTTCSWRPRAPWYLLLYFCSLSHATAAAIPSILSVSSRCITSPCYSGSTLPALLSGCLQQLFPHAVAGPYILVQLISHYLAWLDENPQASEILFWKMIDELSFWMMAFIAFLHFWMWIYRQTDKQLCHLEPFLSWSAIAFKISEQVHIWRLLSLGPLTSNLLRTPWTSSSVKGMISRCRHGTGKQHGTDGGGMGPVRPGAFSYLVHSFASFR